MSVFEFVIYQNISGIKTCTKHTILEIKNKKN